MSQIDLGHATGFVVSHMFDSKDKQSLTNHERSATVCWKF